MKKKLAVMALAAATLSMMAMRTTKNVAPFGFLRGFLRRLAVLQRFFSLCRPLSARDNKKVSYSTVFERQLGEYDWFT